jgi:hypothetical protein
MLGGAHGKVGELRCLFACSRQQSSKEITLQSNDRVERIRSGARFCGLEEGLGVRRQAAEDIVVEQLHAAPGRLGNISPQPGTAVGDGRAPTIEFLRPPETLLSGGLRIFKRPPIDPRGVAQRPAGASTWHVVGHPHALSPSGAERSAPAAIIGFVHPTRSPPQLLGCMLWAASLISLPSSCACRA